MASVVQGRALTGQAPDGAVPIESGTTRRHDAREDRGALALSEPAREPENLNIGVTGANLAITTVLFMKATESARNPSVSAISDQRERGRVLNEAWARFQAANLPAMLSSALLGWRSGALGTTRSCGRLPWRARKTCCSEDRPSTRLPLPSSGRPRQRSPGEAPRPCARAPNPRPVRRQALAVRLLRFTGNRSRSCCLPPRWSFRRSSGRLSPSHAASSRGSSRISEDADGTSGLRDCSRRTGLLP